MTTMYKVNVSVPAVCTNVGPGYDVIGLALNLRNVVEMSLSGDDQLAVEIIGQGEGVLPQNYYNPVMRAAIRLFQELETAPVGLNVRCRNEIPLDVGLSARVSMIVGGLVGANSLLGNPLARESLIELASELSGQPEAVVTAMRGGMGLCAAGAGDLLYRSIEITPLRVVVALPDLPDYSPRLRADLPAQVSLADAVANLGHSTLLVEALRSGDFELLARTLDDRLVEPHRRPHIPGYDDVVSAAKNAGALGVVLCGAGPALMAFALYNHSLVELALREAFAAQDISAQTWSISADTQGVVISVVQ